MTVHTRDIDNKAVKQDYAYDLKRKDINEIKVLKNRRLIQCESMDILWIHDPIKQTTTRKVIVIGSKPLSEEIYLHFPPMPLPKMFRD